MTHEFYKNKLNNIQIQIEYTEQLRMLEQGQKVTCDGLEWEFTGNCEIDDETGNVVYELDNNGFVVYRIFDELEEVG